jgi:diguanylate cyclase (GGDEF)-like protein
MGTNTIVRLHVEPTEEPGEACLVFVEAPPTLLGQRIPLQGEIVLGRDPACAVRLDAEDVSRLHARVAPDGAGHVVGDLGSLNGTWVNGLEVERRRLASGDRIRVGPYVAKYLAAGDAEATYHAELHRRATTDGLTELANRSTFEGWLPQEVARARLGGRPLALLLVDVDHFKRVNDQRGHAAGDQVLRILARRLREAVRGEDLLARIGGEEFGVLIPGVDLAGAAEVGERVRSLVNAEPVAVPEGSVAVTVSTGVAALEPQDDELSFVSRADVRLYEAKRDGRDCVRA